MFLVHFEVFCINERIFHGVILSFDLISSSWMSHFRHEYCCQILLICICTIFMHFNGFMQLFWFCFIWIICWFFFTCDFPYIFFIANGFLFPRMSAWLILSETYLQLFSFPFNNSEEIWDEQLRLNLFFHFLKFWVTIHSAYYEEKRN